MKTRTAILCVAAFAGTFFAVKCVSDFHDAPDPELHYALIQCVEEYEESVRLSEAAIMPGNNTSVGAHGERDRAEAEELRQRAAEHFENARFYLEKYKKQDPSLSDVPRILRTRVAEVQKQSQDHQSTAGQAVE